MFLFGLLEKVDWTKSHIHSLLNCDFIKTAFSKAERLLLAAPIFSDNSLESATDQEPLIVLSEKEAKKYFATDKDRRAWSSEKKMNTEIEEEEAENTYSWRLRTKGRGRGIQKCVALDGV